MKRLIPVLFVVLLLAGCTSAATPSKPEETNTPASIHIGYEVNSTIEQQTDGAVCMYTLYSPVVNLEMLDNGVVLVDNQGKMALLKGSDETISSFSTREMTVLSVCAEEVIGFVPSTRTVVVLDHQLRQSVEYTIEEGLIGMPVAGASTREVYYCVEGYIRALSLDTGLTRHVMEYVPESQTLNGCYFGGELIGWNNGNKNVYLSSKDGQAVFQESALSNFQTGTTNYYGVYLDGFVEQYIWGSIDGQPVQLELTKEQIIYPQMHADCVITAQTVDKSVCFRRYNMSTGACESMVTISFPRDVMDICANDQFTWILTEDRLYRWENTQSKNVDDTRYTISLIDENNPDLDGLAICQQRAQTIGEAYGVDIHIWEDALLNDDTYTITGEYQVDTINSLLDGLEQQLAQMPSEIFTLTEEYCGMQFCLVRKIEGHSFIQYRAEGGLCIAITPTADLQEALLTGLGWGIDSRVIGNSRDLDYWDDLNPDGFTYDYSYFINSQRTDLRYLENADRAFADQRSMSFPSEDRARIFYYAMLDGNEELFTAPIMQQKLKTFCEGIREAYGWQKDSRVFQWEQYLQESLAYSK